MLAGLLVGQVHLLGQFEIEQGHLILREVRGQAGFHLSAVGADAPLGVVVLGFGELPDLLHEGVGLLELVESEGLGQCVEFTFGFPPVGAASGNEVFDFGFIHSLQIHLAFFVVSFEFVLKGNEEMVGEGEA